MKTAQQPSQPTDLLVLERSLLARGFERIAGIDEAGRGPLAGPVVAAACLLDPENPIAGLDDSKRLTPKKRAHLYEQIVDRALAFSVALVEAQDIDRINIARATRQAMATAVRQLPIQPDYLLVDAVKLEELSIPYEALIKGDARSASIAAASILAKVTRDTLMVAYDSLYPAYGFARHKGYGTQAHYEQLLRAGPCPIHRQSFLKTLDRHR